MYGDPSSFEELAARVADLESALDPQTLRNSLEYTTNPRGLKDTYRLLVPSGQTSPWVPLPYQGTYADYAGGNQPGQFSIDSIGHVFLRGVVTKTGGLPVNGDTIAIIPAGYRPIGNVIVAIASGAVNAASIISCIAASGAINLATYNGAGELDYMDLTPLNWFVK